MDWTGSAAQRRPQGTCRPPRKTGAANDQARFQIPAGTLLSVCKVNDSRKRWRAHTTRRELSYERYETYICGAYVFREQGWFILVKGTKVRRRDR